MTRQNFMKGLALAFVVFLIFYACTSEQDYMPNDKDAQQAQPLTTADAKAWYEKNFGVTPHLKSGEEEESPVLSPDWDLSQLYEDSLWYAVESPLTVENDVHINLMTMEVNQYVEAQGDKSLARQVLRLIVLRNKEDGTTYSFMMAVIPNLDYMLKKGESIEKNKYLTRQTDLSGLVYFYTVDGRFVNGWLYEDGRIVAGTHFDDAGGTKGAIDGEVIYCWNQDFYVGGVYHSTKHYCEMTIHTMFTNDAGRGGGGDGGVSRDPGITGGGGGSRPIVDEKPIREEPADPCANMANKVSSPGFVSMLNELRGLTKKNYEAGRSYGYNDAKFGFTNRDGSPGDPEIKYVPFSVNKIGGFIHSHYDGTLRTFSPSDLVVPYNWFMKASGISDLNTFSLGLVTSEGTYFLFVTDFSKYKEFGKKFGDEGGQLYLSFLYEKNGITPNTNDADSMKFLVGLLDKYKTGLTVLKNIGNNTYGIMTKDRNGNVKIINCN